jgi:hypothetical protein
MLKKVLTVGMVHFTDSYLVAAYNFCVTYSLMLVFSSETLVS